MPDRNPNVVVTDAEGKLQHAGEARRVDDQNPAPPKGGTQVTVTSPGEPPFMASWPSWAKMTWSYGPFLIILLIYIMNERERSAERREDRAEARANRLEEKELRKLELTQRDREAAARDRRDDTLIAELRAMTAKIEADRLAESAEAKLRRQGIEEAQKLMNQLVKDVATVMEGLKRLKVYAPPKKTDPPADDKPQFLFSLPLSIPQRMPELAPAPRLVLRRFTVDDDGGRAGPVRDAALPDDGGR